LADGPFLVGKEALDGLPDEMQTILWNSITSTEKDLAVFKEALEPQLVRIALAGYWTASARAHVLSSRSNKELPSPPVVAPV
jgi:hypothetical protein